MSRYRDKKQTVKPTEPLLTRQRPKSRISEPVTISFRYVKPGDRFCLSHCGRDQVKAYKDLLRRLTTVEWRDVLSTSTKNKANKTGFGYTSYKDTDLRAARPGSLDKGIQISGVRASGKARLFGAYKDGVYYVLWFDSEHKIVAG